MQLPNFGVSFSNPNFSDYAKAHGCYSYEASTNEELEQHLIASLKKDKGIHLITADFSYKNAIVVT